MRFHLTWAVVVFIVLGAVGCRPVHPIDPTAPYEPMLERQQVRAARAAAEREVEESDGLRQQLASLAMELYGRLDALYGRSHSMTPGETRAEESAIFSDYLGEVDRVARAAVEEPPEPADVSDHADPVKVTVEGLLESAERCAAEGRYAEAITTVEDILERLPLDPSHAPLVTHLNHRMGLWYLASGDFERARTSFESVGPARELLVELVEEAHLMAEQIDLLLLLPVGAERDRLARGWAILEMGDIDGALALGREIAATTTHADIQREASYLVSEAGLARAGLHDDLLRRARVDIADGPPFEIAHTCLRVMEESGGDEAVAEIAHALREAKRQLALSAEVQLDEAWALALKESRELVAQDRFRDAAALFERFDGTALEERGQEEAARTLDILVREERRRAGDLFVAAQQESDPGRRRQLLEAAREILVGLATEFPGSSYADRVQRNLQAVDEALAALP